MQKAVIHHKAVVNACKSLQQIKHNRKQQMIYLLKANTNPVEIHVGLVGILALQSFHSHVTTDWHCQCEAVSRLETTIESMQNYGIQKMHYLKVGIWTSVIPVYYSHCPYIVRVFGESTSPCNYTVLSIHPGISHVAQWVVVPSRSGFLKTSQ